MVPMPSTQDLVTGDATVHANLMRPKSYEVQLTCTGMPETFPLPPSKGAPTPIEHVFLIVRENKTYDAVLGDLPDANGRRRSGHLRRRHHAQPARAGDALRQPRQLLLARRAVAAGARVDDGEHGQRLHREGLADHVGARHAAARRLLRVGLSSSTSRMPATRTAWEHLDHAGVAYHNYGEITNTVGAIHVYDVGYPGVFFNTGIARRRQDRVRHRQPARQDVRARAVLVHLAAERSHRRHVTGDADAAVDGRGQRRGDRALHRRAVALELLGVVGRVRDRGRSAGRRRPRRDASLAVPGDLARGSSAATRRACTTTCRRCGTRSRCCSASIRSISATATRRRCTTCSRRRRTLSRTRSSRARCR